MTRMGYGVTYVNIKQESNADIGNFATALPDTLSGAVPKFKNSFIGAGPKLTFDGQFDILPSLGFVGGLGGSLVFGKAEAQYTIIDQLRDGNGLL